MLGIKYKQMSKIDNIKRLYREELKRGSKMDFLLLLATDLDLNPQSIRTHWFSGFWAIPEKYQDRVIELLQNTIKQQEVAA